MADTQPITQAHDAFLSDSRGSSTFAMHRMGKNVAVPTSVNLWTLESRYTTQQSVTANSLSVVPNTTASENQWMRIDSAGLLTWKAAATGTYRVMARADAWFDAPSTGAFDFQYVGMRFQTGAADIAPVCRQSVFAFDYSSGTRSGDLYMPLYVEHIVTVSTEPAVNSTALVSNQMQLLFDNAFPHNGAGAPEGNLEIESLQIVVQRLHDPTRASTY
jgi:hypothetical protein